ncbi:MAG: HDOD domain-containing protein [Syntrophobacteraceae bacterium]
MIVEALDRQEIRYRLSQIKELPPLPAALQRLLEIIYSEVETPGELESIISYDPSLAAKILAVANSAYFGYRDGVKTLSKAIAVIGTAQVKSICMYTLLMGLFSSGCTISETHRQMLWKHAFACSRIAVEVNRRRPWINIDQAAAMGLLHDLGWMVMAAHFNKQFTDIFHTAEKKHIPPWYVESSYGLDHGRLGRYVACRWALPQEFQAVMEFHHAPGSNGSFGADVGMVYLINVLSHSREYPELVNEDETLSQCRKLCISEVEWEEYQEMAEAVWPEVEQLWNLLGQGPK